MKKTDTRWSRAYLNGVLSAKKWIAIYNKKINDLRSEICSIGGAGYEERIAGTGGNAMEERLVRYLTKMDEFRIRWMDKREEQIERQEEAIERIMLLGPGRCREFLLRYYVDGVPETDIAVEFGYIEGSSIYHLHKRALEKFEHLANIHGWKHHI